ncbi:SCO family protein [Neptunicella sp. SCSIO 80796]|uniref:SCO family protein n=1 Tax=Neptunicella plasticusilytica TaxID=3117012 RepID=UPI003A4D40FE
MNLKSVFIGLLLILSLAGGIYLSAVIKPDDQIQYANLYPQPRELGDFQLTDQNSQPLDKTRLQNHWTLTFVGYTFCPDICPTTLAELQSIYPDLQKIDSQFPIQILFISVDPKRDTTERLKQYIEFFNPQFIAASAEHKTLFPLIRKMGMMYGMNDSTDNENYLVDHSASVVVVNPSAQVIGRFKPEHKLGQPAISSGQQILADMPAIVQTYH